MRPAGFLRSSAGMSQGSSRPVPGQAREAARSGLEAPGTGLPSGAAPAKRLSPGTVLALQRQVGNRQVQRLLGPAPRPAIMRQDFGSDTGTVSAGAAEPPQTAAGAGGGGPSVATSPQNPASGIDWVGLLTGDTALNLTRTALEFGRLIPGAGLIPGAAADVIEGFQDVRQIAGEAEAHPIATRLALGLILSRDLVALVNNAIGHFAYVTQLAQNGLIVSGVAIPLTPLSAAALEELLFIKQVPNGLQIAFDYLTQWTAAYMAIQAPPGSPSREAWEGLVVNYSVNLAGDFLETILDWYDIATLGAGQGQVVKGVARPILTLAWTIIKTKAFQKAFFQAIFDIWGGSLLPDQGEQPSGATLARVPGGERPADGSGRMPPAAAAEIILGELGQMTAAHGVGNDLLAGAEAFLADGMAQLEDLAAAASGTRDPFVAARDAITESLSEFEDRIAQLTGIGEMSAQGKELLHSLLQSAEGALSALDTVHVPDVELPSLDLGEGALADVVEGVANTGVEAAEAALQSALDGLQGVIDEALAMAREPLQTIMEQAAEVGEFLDVVVEQSTAQAEMLRGMVDEMGAALARCGSFEDVVDLLLGDIAGVGDEGLDAQLAGAKSEWEALGPELAQATAWAEGLRASPAVETSAAGGPVMDGRPPSED